MERKREGDRETDKRAPGQLSWYALSVACIRFASSACARPQLESSRGQDASRKEVQTRTQKVMKRRKQGCWGTGEPGGVGRGREGSKHERSMSPQINGKGRVSPLSKGVESLWGPLTASARPRRIVRTPSYCRGMHAIELKPSTFNYGSAAWPDIDADMDRHLFLNSSKLSRGILLPKWRAASTCIEATWRTVWECK